jgi:hypothetical protein
MMRLSSICVTFTLLLAACGGAQQQVSTDAGVERWTGTFVPLAQRTGSALPRGQHRTTGQVVMTTTPTARTRVSLSLTSAAHQGNTLRWALLPGGCGSAAMPLLSGEQFPTIDIGGSGRGQLEMEMPIRLEYGNSYHVNVYEGLGMQLSNVVACANLRT